CSSQPETPERSESTAICLLICRSNLPTLTISTSASMCLKQGSSFEENAQLKATTYCGLAGVLTLADDSGLEVDALAGAPGVLSARYGGPDLDDGDRLSLLLSNMAHVPGWKRTARFRAVLALAAPPDADILETTNGTVEGAICHEPVGKGGFGYDPVFWLPEKAMTMAQLTAAEKNALSHRGKAAIAMSRFLATLA
ncbi:dITP/XTP pyrophosphatase, partial [Geodia barretti]